jgi:hypothetical protein
MFGKLVKSSWAQAGHSRPTHSSASSKDHAKGSCTACVDVHLDAKQSMAHYGDDCALVARCTTVLSLDTTLLSPSTAAWTQQCILGFHTYMCSAQCRTAASFSAAVAAVAALLPL